MTKLKKSLLLGAAVLTIGATSLTAFAASSYKTPAEAVAGITGKTVESVIAEKTESDKTYGEIAKDAGKLDEFKTEILEIKKDNLSQQIADGKITQEKADEIIEAVEDHQKDCDGTGSGNVGQKLGARFGSNGSGLGNKGANRGSGQGNGQRNGRGTGMRGNGLRDGSCNTATN